MVEITLRNNSPLISTHKFVKTLATCSSSQNKLPLWHPHEITGNILVFFAALKMDWGWGTLGYCLECFRSDEQQVIFSVLTGLKASQWNINGKFFSQMIPYTLASFWLLIMHDTISGNLRWQRHGFKVRPRGRYIPNYVNTRHSAYSAAAT